MIEETSPTPIEASFSESDTRPIQTVEHRVREEIHEGSDARGNILYQSIRESVVSPSPDANPRLKSVAEQYTKVKEIVADLETPGKTSEAIVLLNGIAGSIGMVDFPLDVELPENATAGERERALADSVRRVFGDVPSVVADRMMTPYIELRATEQQRYDRLVEVVDQEPGQVSRADVRRAAFDRRLVGYDVLAEERRLLADVGADRGLRFNMRRARAEDNAGRLNTDAALARADESRRQALENRISEAQAEIARREAYLVKLEETEPITGQPISIDLLAGEIPDRINQSLDVNMRKLHVKLMPLIDSIKSQGGAIHERSVQLQNAVKGAWKDLVVDSTAAFGRTLQEKSNDWRARSAREEAERDQKKIRETRSYYDNRHQAAIDKQMKVEMDLVRRQGREHGLSAARIEQMVVEREQQYAETKRPNENIAYFQEKLKDHVRVLTQAEIDTQLVEVVTEHTPHSVLMELEEIDRRSKNGTENTTQLSPTAEFQPATESPVEEGSDTEEIYEIVDGLWQQTEVARKANDRQARRALVAEGEEILQQLREQGFFEEERKHDPDRVRFIELYGAAIKTLKERDLNKGNSRKLGKKNFKAAYRETLREREKIKERIDNNGKAAANVQ